MPTPHAPMRRLPRTARLAALLAMLVATASSCCGCAAFSNPTADAVPVRRLPPEVLGPSKDDEKQVPLSSLRQPAPEVYLLGPEDVLGVYIEGVLGDSKQPLPVILGTSATTGGGGGGAGGGIGGGGHSQPPSFGYPLPVRADGTLPLPLVPPIKVSGLSVAQAQEAIIKAYTVTKKILRPGRERILVSLIRPRQYHVLVLRSDLGATTVGSQGGFGSGGSGSGGTFISETLRSAGFSIDLPAYENDVLNALTQTGGLPGFEAEREIIVERARRTGREGQERTEAGCAGGADGTDGEEGENGGRMLRIPLRVLRGERANIRPQDVILGSGDIVHVRVRRGEIFYTGGLLPSRSIPLPRNRDLDIVEALALVGAPIFNGGFNANNLSGNVINSGLGSPSPSLVTVLRRTPSHGQVAIRVSLNRAFRDPRERIRVQPGDVVLLQESLGEAFTRYWTTNLRFNFLGTIINQADLKGTATLNAP